jgi:hypothetical protein
MDRGQAHTLEAFMAALLVVSGVLFALGATAVTPLSASTSNQHIQNQQLAVANDLLATADANGTLRQAVVHWNATAGGFSGAGDAGYYTAGGPPTAFGRVLNETFRDQRVAFNVYVVYWSGTKRKSIPMTYMGAPSDNAVRATRTVVLYNDTELSAPGMTSNVSEAGATGDFYAPDLAVGSELYNVVEVRITAWRM